jgi:hypothetical protein
MKNTLMFIICGLSVFQANMQADFVENALKKVGFNGYSGVANLSISAAFFVASVWMAKETCRDMGLTYLEVKKQLEEFERVDMVEAEQYYGVTYSPFERNMAKLLQFLYLAPGSYSREIASAGIAAILYYMSKSFFKQSTITWLNIYARIENN